MNIRDETYTSCDGEDCINDVVVSSDPPNPYLNVSPASFNVSTSSGTRSFSISSNTSWTISDNTNWISVSPSSGSNNTDITITYSENNGTERVGVVTVSGTEVSDKTVTITQNAASIGTVVQVNPEEQTVGIGAPFLTTIEVEDVSNLDMDLN